MLYVRSSLLLQRFPDLLHLLLAPRVNPLPVYQMVLGFSRQVLGALHLRTIASPMHPRRFRIKYLMANPSHSPVALTSLLITPSHSGCSNGKALQATVCRNSGHLCKDTTRMKWTPSCNEGRDRSASSDLYYNDMDFVCYPVCFILLIFCYTLCTIQF